LPADKISTKSYLKGIYGNIPAPGVKKTKPIQSQTNSISKSRKRTKEARVSGTFRDLGWRKSLNFPIDSWIYDLIFMIYECGFTG